MQQNLYHDSSNHLLPSVHQLCQQNGPRAPNGSWKTNKPLRYGECKQRSREPKFDVIKPSKEKDVIGWIMELEVLMDLIRVTGPNCVIMA